MSMITGKNIGVYQMMVQLSALKMETLGMKRRGTSAFKIIKQTYGLKGTKEKVYEDFKRIVEQAKLDNQ
jgi:hypothetical protein